MIVAKMATKAAFLDSFIPVALAAFRLRSTILNQHSLLLELGFEPNRIVLETVLRYHRELGRRRC
jgi:hypothetical protein